jgi:Bacterial mobilisation protein (MobC)
MPERKARDWSKAKRQRTEQIVTRWTPQERAELEARSARAGLTATAYLRQQALGGAGPRARRRPPVDADALLMLEGQLGRIGNNLNQLARAANAGGWPSAFAIEDATQALMATCDAIVAALGKGPSG